MTERMIYNAESFRIPSVAAKRLPAGQAGLTLQPERPYAKRGSARMNDTLPELQKTEAAPVQPIAVDREKEKKEIEQNPRFKALNERVKAIKSLVAGKENKELSGKELDEHKKQYAALHAELTGIKLFTSPRLFLRALLTAGPYEGILRQRLEHRIGKEETTSLKESGLTEEAKKVKKAHIAENITKNQAEVLKLAWERYFTKEELSDPQLQESISSAIALGYLPDTKVAKHLVENAETILGTPSEKEQDLLKESWELYFTAEELSDPHLRHAVERAAHTGYLPGVKAAKQLAENAQSLTEEKELDETIDNEVRKQKAWNLLIQSRHAVDAAFEVKKLDEAARQEEINETVREHARELQRREIDLERKTREAAGEKFEAPEIIDPPDAALPELQRKVEQVILAAHTTGTGGVYHYSLEDIRHKHDLLHDAGFTSQEIRTLMEAGIVGTPDATGDTAAERDATAASMLDAHGQPGAAPGENEQAGTPEEPGVIEEQEQYYERLRNGQATGETPGEIDEFQQQMNTAQENAARLAERVQGYDQTRLRDFLQARDGLQGDIRRLAEEFARKTKRGVPVQEDVARIQQEFQPQLAAALAALDTGDLNQARNLSRSAIGQLFNRERDYITARREAASGQMAGSIQERGGGRQIHNLNDVAYYIMDSNPNLWASRDFVIKNQIKDESGRLLTDDPNWKPWSIVDEDGNIKQENLVRWYRERINYYHSFDPDQPVNFMGEIKIDSPNLFRQVSLNTMYDNYGTYFKDDKGTIHKPLREAALQHAWLVGQVRNMDVQYRQNMSDDSKFADLMVGLFKPNTFGKEFEGVNTLAGLFAMDAEFDPSKKIGEGDMQLGDAMRNSFLFYYNMTDEKKLRELFPNFDTILSKEVMDNAIKDVMRDYNRNPDSDQERAFFEKEAGLDKEILKLYKDGRVDKENVGKFLWELNVFNPPTKNRIQIAIGRNLIKQLAGEASGLSEKNDKSSLDFAELTAYLMTFWTGAASRQDVTFTALNAFTKTQHFQGYLRKQADPSRAGGIGNPHEYPSLKQISADPMTGILTNSGKTTIEILEELQKVRSSGGPEDEKKQETREILSTWAYSDMSWRQYAPQHLGNAFKEFHDRTSGKEIHIDSFVSYDVFGRLAYDQSKMISELQEGLIKPSRYRWATHKLPYHMLEREFKGQKNGKAIYETSSMAESMFGPQVLINAAKMQLREYEVKLKRGTPEQRAEFKEWLGTNGFLDKVGRLKPLSAIIDKKGRYIRTPKKDDEGNVVKDADGETVMELSPAAKALLEDRDHSNIGRILTKSYLLNKFAVQLYSTSAAGRGHKYLDYATRELIIGGLSHIPAGVHVDDDTDFTTSHFNQWYFNEFDIELMRRMSGNGVWQNFGKAIAMDIFAGGAEGSTKGFAHFFKEIFRK
jgi:hypothetical protein